MIPKPAILMTLVGGGILGVTLYALRGPQPKRRTLRGLGVIKTYRGKTTPKQKANELLMEGIARAREYWTEHDEYVSQMTEREIAAVSEQMGKQGDRLARILGYQRSWPGVS